MKIELRGHYVRNEIWGHQVRAEMSGHYGLKDSGWLEDILELVEREWIWEHCEMREQAECFRWFRITRCKRIDQTWELLKKERRSTTGHKTHFQLFSIIGPIIRMKESISILGQAKHFQYWVCWWILKVSWCKFNNFVDEKNDARKIYTELQEEHLGSGFFSMVIGVANQWIKHVLHYHSNSMKIWRAWSEFFVKNIEDSYWNISVHTKLIVSIG